MTAAVHGDELNGIEIVRRLMNELDPAGLSGTVVGVPIVNYLGYARGSRLPDRRDLNRYFPGTTSGSSASRIAHSFFSEVVSNCQALVDFHTRILRSQESAAGARRPAHPGRARVLARLRSDRGTAFAGFARHAAPCRGGGRHSGHITFEVGSPMLEPAEIDHAVQALHTLLHKMGMTRSFRMGRAAGAVLRGQMGALG
ncbi:MAG: succinylglutamate desuccinylase/aspartoacylase family protein [Xanthomonadales bacterium]|nr:succinylglutamate desuccinylase/aspartoacylase family protein [Xanthomonadales bacterium]